MSEPKRPLVPGQAIEFNVSLWGVDQLPEGAQGEGVAWVTAGLPHQRDGRGEVLLVRSER